MFYFLLDLPRCIDAGTLAQLVEQRTENPCVPSSILGGTTILSAKKTPFYARSWLKNHSLKKLNYRLFNLVDFLVRFQTTYLSATF